MTDLFGDTVTSPQTVPAKNVLNAAWGFPEFWAAWPSGPRKVAKQQCLNKWATLGCASEASHIRAHVEWMKTQDEWLRGFVPMPMTYLNQRRWDEWEPPKPTPKQPDALTIIKAHKGVKPSAEIRAKIAQLRKGTP